ncbi:MBL fold metallo-hydrolase [Glaciecola petra]|uniref:MBL fold metallo-hydrolase n=1 Tax=Glaciecola petra TaxID=3075602 RepID=A0ABU2ZXA8_9ALTE|nr:MBL fold metallo-hydrolase [Aestuariibacter sp. P117]MDT0596663.1 MBL fold metallo-hydrolase [Aestuariibacter sp. P117]
MAIEFVDVDIPELGAWQQIAEGILWLRMPLPFELDHINLYLLEDHDPISGQKGYTLIDTGIGVSKTQVLWETLLEKLSLPLLKVVVTHMHPDHIGMAGYLVDKFRVPLYMSHSEYFVARAISAGSRGASDWQDDEYLLRCGMPSDYIETASKNRKESKGVGQVIRPIPVQYERLQAGDTLTIGANEWQVLIGRGHSPEHVCLFNKKSNVLISGDHVLPIISPNIGVYSTEPNANPLKLYLETLPQFKHLPTDCLVLPSHKRPFIGLHKRVDGLIAHHQAHLDNLREFCEEGKTIQACLPILFKRKLNQHSMFFALAEAFAHLNYLYFAGECSRSINENGHLEFTILKT